MNVEPRILSLSASLPDASVAGLVANCPALITTFTSGSVAVSFAKAIVVGHGAFHHAELSENARCRCVVMREQC